MDFLSDQAESFPQTDNQGNEFFRTYQFTLTGTQYKHDGDIPENFLNDAMIGDEVQLFWDKNNRYDKQAIKVLWKGRYIGWLPARAEKETIIRRLERNQTVLARIKNIHFIKIREKTGEKDEYGNEIWEDAKTKTADVVIAVYKLPQRKSKEMDADTSHVSQIETDTVSQPIQQPVDDGVISPKSEKQNNPNNMARGCGCSIALFIVIFLLMEFILNRIFDFIGF